MLNKKNAAYAVIGFALVGCNNVLGACNCCKSVPKELEMFTVILKDLKGATFATLSDFFKSENYKEEFLGKDLISKNLVGEGDAVNNEIIFYIVNIDEKKNEMKVYAFAKSGEMKRDCKGKKCKSVKLKFKAVDGKENNFKNDETKYKVDSIEIKDEEDVPNS